MKLIFATNNQNKIAEIKSALTQGLEIITLKDAGLNIEIDEMKFRGEFDIVLANINKNVLLAEMSTYSSYLETGGQLLLSGFYTKDISDLLEEAHKHGLAEINRDERENWASLLLRK